MNATSIPRLARNRPIRFKSGASLHVLDNQKFARNNLALFRKDTAIFADMYAEDMAGFVMIVWDGKGHSNCSFTVSEASPIGTRLLPTFAAESIRREASESDAEKVVKRMFNVPEGS